MLTSSPVSTIHSCFKLSLQSHYTYERSKQKEMVVDIQGCGSTYTDPQLHSVQKLYGRADRGTVGFGKFFATHTCNGICHMLDLPDRSKQLYFG